MLKADAPRAKAPETPLDRLVVTAFRLGIVETVADLYDWTVEDLTAAVIERIEELTAEQTKAAAQAPKPLHIA